MLPSSADVSCLFRTKVHPPTESVLYNDVFRAAISQAALQQKTLRVDLCSVSKHRREECLVGAFLSLSENTMTPAKLSYYGSANNSYYIFFF